MSGTSIFHKPSEDVTYYDQISIGGYLFEAAITVREIRGNPSASHCGRIVSLEMTIDSDIMVSLYDDGQWYEYPDDTFGEGVLATQLIVNEWSKDDPAPFAGRHLPYRTDLY